MNEADTRANLIEPKLKASGWTDRQVTREYYYQRDHQYAPGRIIPRQASTYEITRG